MGVFDLLAHGAAGFKAREAPPDHGHIGQEALGAAAEEVRLLDKVRQADIGDHHDEPDDGHAPEEVHEGVGHAAGHLHAPRVQDGEEQDAQAGQDQVAHRQFNAEGGEHGFEVECESEGFTAGYADDGDNVVPAGQEAHRPGEPRQGV